MAIGMTSAITVGTKAKCQMLTTTFTKYLSNANPNNGEEFLFEVLIVLQFHHHSMVALQKALEY